jgi:hypothetical protein
MATLRYYLTKATERLDSLLKNIDAAFKKASIIVQRAGYIDTIIDGEQPVELIAEMLVVLTHNYMSRRSVLLLS